MLRWNQRCLAALGRRCTPYRFKSTKADIKSTLTERRNVHVPDRWTRQFLTPPTLSKAPFSPPTRLFIYAAAALLGWHVFTIYFYSWDLCDGISMLPTFASFGDHVIISKYYRRGRALKVGDIVSFQHPVNGWFAIKRIVGMEGDFVLMDTPYKSDAMIQVPQGHCWVAGDNLAQSRDSRHFGPLPMALIHGKVIFKYNFNHLWAPPLDHDLKPAPVDDNDLD